MNDAGASFVGLRVSSCSFLNKRLTWFRGEKGVLLVMHVCLNACPRVETQEVGENAYLRAEMYGWRCNAWVERDVWAKHINKGGTCVKHTLMEVSWAPVGLWECGMAARNEWVENKFISSFQRMMEMK